MFRWEVLCHIQQFTAGDNHPVKVNGLHDILLAYPEHIQNRIVEKRLICVAPTGRKLNAVQPLLITLITNFLW